MSYAQSAALQEAVYTALNAVSVPVYDAVPAGALPPLYVSLGAETALDASDQTGQAAVHRFTVSILSENSSFHKAKTIAAEVCDALIDAELSLSRGRLVSLTFNRARAIRIRQGAGRQIDLRFRARVDDL